MYVMSFEKYDAMTEEVENMEKPEKLISIKELAKSLYEDGEELTEEKLKEILASIQFSEDKDYKKGLNNILTDVLMLVEEEELPTTQDETAEKYTVTAEELQELVEKVKSMDFQCTYWYPAIEDLKNHEFKANYTDVCFLLWIIHCDMELTKDEEFVRDYATAVLKDKLQIVKE